MIVAEGTWKYRLIDAILSCKALNVYQRLSGGGCTVLLYHSVAPGENNPFCGANEYAAHMDLLRSEFRVISAEEYLWHLNNKRRFARRSILITLDDGYENNYSVVRPIMEERQLPWVLFSTTQALDEPDCPLWFAGLRAVCLYAPRRQIELLGCRWDLGDTTRRLRVCDQVVKWAERGLGEERIQSVRDWVSAHWTSVPQAYEHSFCTMMTAGQLYELDQSPLVETGCHTRSHPFLTRVPDDRLHLEIDEPSARLASLLGRRIRMFAYPAGVYGRREVERVSSLGFDCAFAVIPTLNRTSRYEIPRVGIYDPGLAVVRAKALGLVALLRSLGIKCG